MLQLVSVVPFAVATSSSFAFDCLEIHRVRTADRKDSSKASAESRGSASLVVVTSAPSSSVFSTEHEVDS